MTSQTKSQAVTYFVLSREQCTCGFPVKLELNLLKIDSRYCLALIFFIFLEREVEWFVKIPGLIYNLTTAVIFSPFKLFSALVEYSDMNF
jgi:hypothetical protein